MVDCPRCGNKMVRDNDFTGPYWLCENKDCQFEISDRETNPNVWKQVHNRVKGR